MTASGPVDDWRPPWSSFAEFFTAGEGDPPHLTELDQEVGARADSSATGEPEGIELTAANLLLDCDGPSQEVPGGVPADSRQVSTS